MDNFRRRSEMVKLKEILYYLYDNFDTSDLIFTFVGDTETVYLNTTDDRDVTVRGTIRFDKRPVYKDDSVGEWEKGSMTFTKSFVLDRSFISYDNWSYDVSINDLVSGGNYWLLTAYNGSGTIYPYLNYMVFTFTTNPTGHGYGPLIMNRTNLIEVGTTVTVPMYLYVDYGIYAILATNTGIQIRNIVCTKYGKNIYDEISYVLEPV